MAIFCVGVFFNFGGSCFGFELSMGLSLPDQWYWRLPGAFDSWCNYLYSWEPWKSRGCYYVMYKLYISSQFKAREIIIRLSNLMSCVSEAIKCCTCISRLRQLLSLAHSILVLEKPICYVSKAVPETPAILENWLGVTCSDNHRNNPRKKSTILANLD